MSEHSEICEFLNKLGGSLKYTPINLCTLLAKELEEKWGLTVRRLEKSSREEVWGFALAWLMSIDVKYDEHLLPQDIRTQEKMLLCNTRKTVIRLRPEGHLCTTTALECDNCETEDDLLQTITTPTRELHKENVELFLSDMELKTKLKDKEEELRRANEALATLEANLKNYKDMCLESPDVLQIGELQREIERLKVANKQLESRAATATLTIPPPTPENEDIQSWKQRYKRSVEDFRIERLELGEAQEELKKLKNENGLLQQRLQKMSNTVTQAVSEKEEAIRDKEKMRSELSEQITDITQILQRKHRMETHARMSLSDSCCSQPEFVDDGVVIELQKRLHDTTKEKEGLFNRLAEAEEEQLKLKRKLSKARDDELAKQISHAQALATANATGELEAALANAMQGAAEAERLHQARMRDVETSLQRARAKCSSLSTRIAQLEESLANTATKAEFAEANERRAVEAMKAAQANLKGLAAKEQAMQQELKKALERIAKLETATERIQPIASVGVKELTDMMCNAQEKLEKAETSAAQVRQQALSYQMRISELQKECDDLATRMSKQQTILRAEQTEKRKLQEELSRLQQQIDTVTLRRANETDQIALRYHSLAVLKDELERSTAALDQARAAVAERDTAVQGALRLLLSNSQRVFPPIALPLNVPETMQDVIKGTNAMKQSAKELTDTLVSQLRASEAECGRLRELLCKKAKATSQDALSITASLNAEQIIAAPKTEAKEAATPVNVSQSSGTPTSTSSGRRKESAPRLAKGDSQPPDLENEPPKQQKLRRQRPNANFL